MPFNTIGGLHAQLNSGPPHVPGESGNADYYYNFTNPFSVMGCDNATGFSKLQTITVYGSPITKLTLGFDNGTVLTVGNCSESCTQSTFSFGTSELVSALNLWNGVSTVLFPPLAGFALWGLGGFEMNTTSPDGHNRTFQAGLSPTPVTSFRTVGAPVPYSVGSGFLCGVYGYLLDTNPSLAAQAGPDLVPNSIIQLGFAFLRPIDQTELVNMQLSQLAADLVTVQPSHVDTYTLVNSQSISESFTKTLTTTYTYANSWTSTSSLQNTFSTQVVSNSGGSNAASVNAEVAVSIFGNGGHVGASDTFTNTWSQSRQTVNSQQFTISQSGTISQTQTYSSTDTFPVIAPPETSLTYNVIVEGGNFNLPWVANLLLTLDTGDVLNVTCQGIFTGVSVTGTSVIISSPQAFTALSPSTSRFSLVAAPSPSTSLLSLVAETVTAPGPGPSPSLNKASNCAMYLLNKTTDAANFSSIVDYGEVGMALNGGGTTGCVVLVF